MKVFISHSFENGPEYENIVFGLTHAGVEHWDPAAEVKPGASLREQLRAAVLQCSVCIFVATHRAVKSSWCGAELGAFWGAGKPILVYLADSSLADDDLPQVVHGDVWERSIPRIASHARELVAQATAADGGARMKTASVGSITVEQLERIIASAVSLAAASAKFAGSAATPEEIGKDTSTAAGPLLEGIKTAERASQEAGEWQNRILWVDDRPSNNEYERRAFEAMGFEFTLALSTEEALRLLSAQRFAAIISDMGRKEGPAEGYVLLDAVRRQGLATPYFIYAGSRAPEHRHETERRGGQGTTNRPRELIDMVVKHLRLAGSEEAPD